MIPAHRPIPLSGLALVVAGGLLANPALAQTAQPAFAQEVAAQCLTRKLAAATDLATVGELRAACAAEAASVTLAVGKATSASSPGGATPVPVITQRLSAERDAANNLYTITAHRPNYFLLGSYTNHRPSNVTFARGSDTDDEAQKVESKFQISVKALVMENAFNGTGDLFVGYTQRSFWQTYNRDASSPFRESNYEPEAWLRRVINKPLLGWNVSALALGVNHQSNGRGNDYSRSWNRVIGSLSLERGQYGVVLRPWWRIPESDSRDNNSDITKYMGHFDLTVLRRIGEHSFDLMLRNNLKAHGNHGAAQLGWSYPLTPTLKVYGQLFSGYGESLLDYNVRQTSVGIGLQLLDW